MSALALDGARVLVTGGSRGIGAACALVFASLGAKVGVHYRKEAHAARRVVDEIRDAGGEAEALAADLARWDEGERLVDEATRALGDLDVVVLNHGVYELAAIDAMTERDFDATMDANLRGFFSVSGACARRMKARKAGAIVLVSSTAGQRGEPRAAAYAASKGAIVSMTKSLAAELAPFAVRVNCVAPGWVATDMSRAAIDDPTWGAQIRASIPVGRVATPEEIAWPIAFVASPRASFVTGEVFNVNGGAVLVG